MAHQRWSIVSGYKTLNMTTGNTIMIQGTASSVGKSTIATALCRILMQDGLSVAPFKAQNMSNNSYVTADGGEMGRAQAVQAAAAGVQPSTDMNPILLKPEADSHAQVVLNGRSTGSVPAREYYRRKTELWGEVTGALERLRMTHDVVVIEGAGSPAEVNLRNSDIANMRVALHAQSPVLLVGDIDRGGVFASLLGTLELLQPDERSLVRGLLINQFRGDRAVLEPLPTMIAERTKVPVIGVVPRIPNLQVREEDATSLDREARPGPCRSGLRAAVIRLPRISNFDDIDPLLRAGVQVEYVSNAAGLEGAHMVVLPGTKSTIADLRWMKSRGLDTAVQAAAARGTAVVGVCGGYQMLGERLDDPQGADSGAPDSEPGIGLLPVRTTFALEKTTRRVDFTVAAAPGLLDGAGPVTGTGYEIHTGRTTGTSAPAFAIIGVGSPPRPDGAVDRSGWVLGAYIHGLFDSPQVLERLLGNVARRHGVQPPHVPEFSMEQEFDRLAHVVRESVDMRFIYSLLDRKAEDRTGKTAVQL